MPSIALRTAATLVLALALSSCSEKPAPETIKLSHDFSAQLAPAGWLSQVGAVAPGISRDDCQKLLAKSVCLTDASADEIESDWSQVTCKPDSSTHLPALMALFDEMPDRIHPLFCSIDRIFISANIGSTAAAVAIYDRQHNVAGAYLEFRLGTFAQQPNIDDLATWKEQLAFGGSSVFLTNNAKLVQISYGLKMTTLAHDGLFYVLNHELGHLVDFSNRVNECHIQGGCTFGDFPAIAWRDERTPLNSASYKFQSDFCYYDCNGNSVKPAQAFEIYTTLPQSAFATTYSGFDSYEDFAESWAWNIMRRYKKPDYVITVPGNAPIKMNDAFTSSALIVKKQAFVDNLWQSPDLKLTNGH